MSAVLISGEFLSYGGVLATFLFTVPISVKIMHVIRAQVRKILVAMEGDDDDDESDDENPV